MAVPTFASEENGIEYKYYRCPRKYIPLSIVKFVNQMNYYKDFQGAEIPSYDNVSPRFRQAYNTFNKYYIQALKEKKSAR
jgi:hypothetical protein